MMVQQHTTKRGYGLPKIEGLSGLMISPVSPPHTRSGVSLDTRVGPPIAPQLS